MALYFNGELAKSVFYSGVKCQKVFFNNALVYQAIYIPEPIKPNPYSVGESGGLYGSYVSEDGNTYVVDSKVFRWNGSAYTSRGTIVVEGDTGTTFLPLDTGDVQSISMKYDSPNIVVVAIHKESNNWASERIGTYTLPTNVYLDRFAWSPDGKHGIMVQKGSYNKDALVRAVTVTNGVATFADADAILGFRYDRNTEDDDQSFCVNYGGRWAALQDKYLKGEETANLRRYMSGVGSIATINVTLDPIRNGGDLMSCATDGTWFATRGANDKSSANNAQLTLYKTDNTTVVFKETGSGARYDNETCGFLFNETGTHGIGILGGDSSSDNNTKFLTALFKLEGGTWVKYTDYSVWLPAGYPSGFVIAASGCLASHLGGGRFNAYRI